MTTLRIEDLIIPSTNFGGENPLPPLYALETASAVNYRHPYSFEENAYVTPQEQSVLPNLLQDQYDRAVIPKPFKTSILENDFLRATFLLEQGGRLWSLLDKIQNKELLFQNPVFRPANLAARDAWFAGGIEWNISLISHCPFTCAPLFAAQINAPDQTPVLRLYEWDRLRCLPFQIDFLLPQNSKFLFTRMRIINPWPRTLPMYWYSNTAVPEDPKTRVLGPANQALRHAYDGKLVAHDLPIADDIDLTYPGQRPYASDLYFRIPQNHRPWIASINSTGYGLAETSTDLLRGRKIFSWGTSPGGRRWQEFLSLPGQAYIETQAGLTPTQGEYLRMPANSSFEWLEAYGPLQTDPHLTHGTNWQAACDHVEAQIESALPRDSVNKLFADTKSLADLPPEKILHSGAGWGALERRRREKSHQPLTAPQALPFPDNSLTPDQTPWITLLETGVLPAQSPKDLPLSPLVQPEWRELLEKSLAAGKSDHWLAWYQVAIMRFGAGEIESAVKAWEISLASTPNAWAYRNLAVIAKSQNHLPKAADLLEKARNLQPKSMPLTIEFARALAAANRFPDLARFIKSLPQDMQSNGRIRQLNAQAALANNDLPTVAAFFENEVDIPNMREKEVSLTTLWFNYQAQKIAAAENLANDAALQSRVRKENPPPHWIDFRASKGD